MTQDMRPLRAGGVALVSGALAAALALWARQQQHRWLHHPPARRRAGR